MNQVIRSIAVFLCLVLSINPFNLSAAAQSPSPSANPAPSSAPGPSDAPVPAQISLSHTVFLSNLGADASFPVDATRAYNDIYKALASWGATSSSIRPIRPI